MHGFPPVQKKNKLLQASGSKKCSSKVAGHNNYYIADFFPKKNISIGFPAVPPGSPSSLHLASCPLSPMTYAKQLCLASQYFFFIASIKASAFSSLSTGATVAINLDFFSIISSCPTFIHNFIFFQHIYITPLIFHSYILRLRSLFFTSYHITISNFLRFSIENMKFSFFLYFK